MTLGLRAYLRLIRVEHTLFSLPFAYAGAVISLRGIPSPQDALLIFTALFGLRSASMAFNDLADLDIDRLNPRTARRPLVSGEVSEPGALAVVALGTILYVSSAWALNLWALLLSPVPWLLAMTYPYSKRVHPVPHLHLGLVLGMAVFGGSVAVAGDWAPSLPDLLSEVPWTYVASVALWVAGFDVIYSIQDEEFDRRMGLGSVPAAVGRERALSISAAMHAVSSALMLASIPLYGLGPLSAASAASASAMMAAEQVLARRGRVREAFNLNLALSLVASCGVLADASAGLLKV